MPPDPEIQGGRPFKGGLLHDVPRFFPCPCKDALFSSREFLFLESLGWDSGRILARFFLTPDRVGSIANEVGVRSEEKEVRSIIEKGRESSFFLVPRAKKRNPS